MPREYRGVVLLGTLVFVSTTYIACGAADERSFGRNRPNTGGDASTSTGGSAAGGGGTTGTGGGTAGGGGSGGVDASSGGAGGVGGSGTGGRTRDSSFDAPDDGAISNSG